jgi:hypothetical protein
MSTLNNNYSGLITKGLGLPANVGILLMGFGVFHVQVFVSSPPNIGGSGGGAYAVPGNQYYTPIGNAEIIRKRSVDITVKFANTKTWRQSYLVTDNQAKHVVKIINIANRFRNNIQLSISNIKQYFNRDKHDR